MIKTLFSIFVNFCFISKSRGDEVDETDVVRSTEVFNAKATKTAERSGPNPNISSIPYVISTILVIPLRGICYEKTQTEISFVVVR